MPVPQGLASVQRLLVVDGDTTFSNELKCSLERGVPPLTVETADSAMDGLLRIGLFRPDAVLLDSSLPGMDTVALCRRLRSSSETAHIIVMATARRRERGIEAVFREAGAAACFSKPLHSAELRDALGIA